MTVLLLVVSEFLVGDVIVMWIFNLFLLLQRTQSFNTLLFMVEINTNKGTRSKILGLMWIFDISLRESKA